VKPAYEMKRRDNGGVHLSAGRGVILLSVDEARRLAADLIEFVAMPERQKRDSNWQPVTK